jgi:hypothetical protein
VDLHLRATGAILPACEREQPPFGKIPNEAAGIGFGRASSRAGFRG